MSYREKTSQALMIYFRIKPTNKSKLEKPMYINSQQTISSLIHLSDAHINNGFIGLICCFRFAHIRENEEIVGQQKYYFDKPNVGALINQLFSFTNIAELSSSPSITNDSFILAENYETSVLTELTRGHQVNAFDIAIVMMRLENIDEEISSDQLIEKFYETYNISNAFREACFHTQNTLPEIELVEEQPDNNQVYNDLKSSLGITTTSQTFSIQDHKFLDKLGGSFGQGTYAQKLIATSATKNLIFIPDSDFHRALSIANTSSINSNTSNIYKNILIFGAAGTGKSTFARKELFETHHVKKENIYEVTFHPEYTYSDFVGSLKPRTYFKSTIDQTQIYTSAIATTPIYHNREPIVGFEFQAGPLIEVALKASKTPTENFALIIDEINRGNVPEILGDTFQLLDRSSNYHSKSNPELHKYLIEQNTEGYFENGFRLPDNLIIYATINPADQNVYPLDTAFKRRWDRKYIAINYNHPACATWALPICMHTIPWLLLIESINTIFIDELDLPEDKQIGQFFIQLSNTPSNEELDSATTKVLSFLWEETPRSKRGNIFNMNINTFEYVLKANQTPNLEDLFSERLASMLSA